MKKSLLTILLILLFVPYCYGTFQNNSLDFAIYLSKDNDLNYGSVLDLEKVELEENPIISLENIIEYNWSQHTIKIRRHDLLDKNQSNLSVGKAFVVVTRGERIYFGGFWSTNSFQNSKILSPFDPQTEEWIEMASPYLKTPKIPLLCIEDFHIHNYNEQGRLIEIYGESKVLNDKRIYEVFKEYNKLIE